MSGPEHYRRAEELAQMIAGSSSYRPAAADVAATAQLAQVHATLALVAVTADPLNRSWNEVTR